MTHSPPLNPNDGAGGGEAQPTAGEVATAIHDAVAFALLQNQVTEHHVDLYDQEKGRIPQSIALLKQQLSEHHKDIDELKHGRTAIYAVIGAISFLAGIATVAAAFLALKP